MINVAKPLVTSRFNVADFKKVCVLNSDVTLENLNDGVSNLNKSHFVKKACSTMKSKRLKKF